MWSPLGSRSTVAGPFNLEKPDSNDKHYINMIQMIRKKYLVLKSKKDIKDRAIRLKVGGKDGHAMHRNRVYVGI